MPNDIDLSTEALLAHREKAEKATPGPWAMQIYNGGPYPGPFQIWSQSAPNGILVSISVEGSRNCAHIAANSPDVVKAHIDEILRLRAEVERLNKEADWLADHCSEFCESYGYCGECPMFHGWLKCVYEVCGKAVGCRGDNPTCNWRRAARKAVEKEA